jgi:nitroreductase
MDVSEAIRTKRAVRKFTSATLSADSIRAILDAGRKAQSSKNQQAWHFLAIQSRETLEKLSSCGQWADHLRGAALGIVILTPDPTLKFQIMFDAGQAAAYMQLAAWEMGIASCLASFYEPERVREILRFPKEWHARIALSFGFPTQDDDVKRPPMQSGRRRLNEVVHYESW